MMNILLKQLAQVNAQERVSSILINYVFKNASNKWFVRMIIPAIFIQLIVFKYFYPYAGFINGDSYAYLETAYHNLSINTYPVGYSMFLRLLSVFTKSDTVLVVFQYLLLQGSVLFLVFTIFYFYKPARFTKILLLVCSLFNPVFLYLANYVSSDAFFLSLSLIWFAQLIWIIHYADIRLVVANAIILFLAFTVRYNALVYPIISVLAFLLSKHKNIGKIVGMALGIALIGLFVSFTSNKYHKLSGYYQFSPFTGWQLANNAMYAYRYVDSAHVKKAPKKLQYLDKMVRNYFDTTRDITKHPEETLMASTVYMWAPNSPLQLYKKYMFKTDSTAPELKKWSVAAPVMAAYGSFLMKAYPGEFIKYYLIPNAVKYYAPPVEFLDSYSTGVDSVQPIAQSWFGYKTNKLKTRTKDYKVHVLDFYPVLTGVMNVVFFFGIISFLFLEGHKQQLELRRGITLVAGVWLLNLGFSVFASSIALRFQLFPIIISFSFSFLLVEFLIRSAIGNGIKRDLEVDVLIDASTPGDNQVL
ncbi:hypothetical protein ACDQ55_09435 [Chitinophaga sp. 30R24]|uniref:hypothetical protein n=1 Tax=Chitinophaga sp. 30R24 TaxID=3248838 RepID=UPI003B8F0B83